MFRKHSRATQSLSLPTSTAVNAARVAANASGDSRPCLSAAAAAAALKIHEPPPTNPAEVVTERMLQRRRSSSLTPSRSRTPDPMSPRPQLARRDSVGSMTERTFRSRSQSPGAGGRVRFDEDSDAPPVPSIPAEVMDERSAPAVRVAPFKVASQKRKDGDAPWHGRAAVGDVTSIRTADTSLNRMASTASHRSASPSVNFSYPRSPLAQPPSPIDEQTLVFDPNTRRMVTRAELLAKERMRQVLDEQDAREREMRTTVGRSSSHLVKGTVGRTKSVTSGTGRRPPAAAAAAAAINPAAPPPPTTMSAKRMSQQSENRTEIKPKPSSVPRLPPHELEKILREPSPPLDDDTDDDNDTPLITREPVFADEDDSTLHEDTPEAHELEYDQQVARREALQRLDGLPTKKLPHHVHPEGRTSAHSPIELDATGVSEASEVVSVDAPLIEPSPLQAFAEVKVGKGAEIFKRSPRQAPSPSPQPSPLPSPSPSPQPHFSQPQPQPQPLASQSPPRSPSRSPPRSPQSHSSPSQHPLHPPQCLQRPQSQSRPPLSQPTPQHPQSHSLHLPPSPANTRTPSPNPPRSAEQSPPRTARFAPVPQHHLAVLHSPPARSASPRKSALKNSSSPTRHMSGDSSEASRDDYKRTAKKKARVSFDDEAIVGEAATPASEVADPLARLNTPVSSASSAHSKVRRWFGLSRARDALAPLEEDEPMQARPTLFGRSGSKKAERSPERVQQWDNERNEANISKYREPLPVSSDESDGEFLEAEGEASTVKEVSATTSTASGATATSTTGGATTTSTTSGTATTPVYIPYTKTTTTPKTSTPKTTTGAPQSLSVPAIALSPSTPSRDSQEEFFDMPGQFPQDAESIKAAKNPESESDGSSIYSDAYEDLSDMDGDGFMSLDAVLTAPVGARLSQKVSGIDPANANTEDWEKVKTYWRSLSAEKRKLLEREALEEAGEEADLEEVEEPKRAKRKKSMEQRLSERQQIMEQLERERPSSRQQNNGQNINPERVYQIRPGTKMPHVEESAVAGNVAGGARLRKSMRPDNNNAQDARMSSSPTGMRKTLRAGSDSSRPGTSHRASNSLGSSPADPQVLAAAMMKNTKQRARANSDSSESSFSRIRPASHAGFRSTLRGSALANAPMSIASDEERPATSKSRFSLRGLSPPGSPTRRRLMGASSDAGFKSTLRGNRPTTADTSATGGSSKLRLLTLGKKGKKGKFSSRFDGSSDEEESPVAFRSRFADSSEEEEAGGRWRGRGGRKRSEPSVSQVSQVSQVPQASQAPQVPQVQPQAQPQPQVQKPQPPTLQTQIPKTRTPDSDLETDDDMHAQTPTGNPPGAALPIGSTVLNQKPARAQQHPLTNVVGLDDASTGTTTTITSGARHHRRRSSLMSMLRRKKPDDKPDDLGRLSEEVHVLQKPPPHTIDPNLPRRSTSDDNWPFPELTPPPAPKADAPRPFSADGVSSGGIPRPGFTHRRSVSHHDGIVSDIESLSSANRAMGSGSGVGSAASSTTAAAKRKKRLTGGIRRMFGLVEE